jgi:hypothetical protein
MCVNNACTSTRPGTTRSENIMPNSLKYVIIAIFSRNCQFIACSVAGCTFQEASTRQYLKNTRRQLHPHNAISSQDFVRSTGCKRQCCRWCGEGHCKNEFYPHFIRSSSFGTGLLDRRKSRVYTPCDYSICRRQTVQEHTMSKATQLCTRSQDMSDTRSMHTSYCVSTQVTTMELRLFT